MSSSGTPSTSVRGSDVWFKVDDKLHDHPKVQRLFEEGNGDALGLWLAAGSWCGDQMSDGLISPFVLARWFPMDWQRMADALVGCAVVEGGAGLWLPDEVGGRPHFRFHDWFDYNDSRDQIESDRRAAAMRMKFHRDGPLKAAILKRDKDRCRYCGTQVNWKAKRGPDAATYDHVVPLRPSDPSVRAGANTLENVVVCCKGCNDRKNRRSLREAGMKLLPPGSLGAPLADEDVPDSAAFLERAGHGSKSATEQPRSTNGSGRVGVKERS